MPSPFDYRQNDFSEGTIGVEPSTFDVLGAGFRTTQDEVAAVQEVRLNEGYGEIEKMLIRMGVDQENLRIQQFDYFGLFPQDVESLPRDFNKIWESLETVRVRNPEMFKDVATSRDEFERRILSRDGERAEDQLTLEAGDFLPAFVGGIGGAFTDPVNIATLPIGGFGKTLVQRIATEGLANAAIEAVQTPDLIRSREALGEETSLGDVAFNIAAAGVGAAAFRGAFEGIGALRGRFANETPDVELDFNDAQLRSMFELQEQSPRMRAGEALLDEINMMERANPYGATPTGEARFIAELSEVQRLMGGTPDTAIARVLPPLPAEYIERQADFQLVKKQAPKVYAKLEEAQAAVRALDEQIADASSRLDNTTIVDAVRLVDEQAAARLEELRAIVNDETLPEPVRTAADIEGGAVITRVGEERIANALADAEIRPRKDLQTLRASRRSANRKLRQATIAVERKRDEIKARQQFFQNLEQRNAVDLLGNAIGGRPFLQPVLNRDAVVATVKSIDDAVERIDETASRLADPVGDTETAVPKIVDGLVDIGLPERVAADFVVPIEQADGSIKEMTIRQVFAEFEKDAALVEAVRSCAL